MPIISVFPVLLLVVSMLVPVVPVPVSVLLVFGQYASSNGSTRTSDGTGNSTSAIGPISVVILVLVVVLF